MTFKRFLPYTFIFLVLVLFLYSFTQVDLSLTLSRASIFQTIEKNFQQIGWFNRPVSTIFFLIILIAMFLYYFSFLRLAIKREIKANTIWKVIILSGLILGFSYIALSYDLFNYIFDAKIITHYHQNPYLHKALDYPTDPMLSFMRWTHRTYPYGPFWLALTVPLSYFGHQIFLLTFFLFKFLAVGFYLGSSYLIYKINKKINPGAEVFNTIFFALSPLVIIECLVSSHNDIAMVFFALLAVYFYVASSKITGIILMGLSAAIKIPTVLLVIPMIFGLLPLEKYKLTNERLSWSLVGFSILGLLYSMTKLEIQPWYFLWVLPFVALLRPNKYVISLTMGISAGLLLRYSGFLYTGNWDAVLFRNIITIIPIAASLIIGYIWSRKKGYVIQL
jgi:hypothetical protein